MAARIETNQCQRSVVNPKSQRKPRTGSMRDAIYTHCQSMSRRVFVPKKQRRNTRERKGSPDFQDVTPDLIVA
jgi:hypothetical protein